jgi:twitching motility protein PilT
MNMLYQQMLDNWVEEESSDLHLKAPNPPFWRIHGNLVPMPEYNPLTDEQVREFACELVGEETFRIFLECNELDAAITLENGRRIRINLHIQSGGTGIALRLLPCAFFPLSSLGLPVKICEEICSLKQGLVLVTGATGSGKSTTLASFINEINETRRTHIVTIEDPVEYRHQTKKSLITQREVGKDTVSFAEALKRILREDPDVVLIGEMRDEETMDAALTLAETGHLTLATLHTGTAVQTVTRLIGSFPANRQEQIRTQLAGSLRYVICQQLLPNRDGDGRLMAAEILVATPAVLSLIRENRIHQISSSMQTGVHLGMTTMNQALQHFVREGKITTETAREYSPDRETLEL